MTAELTELAKELRNKYYREWRRNNPDKAKKNASDYWLRKAQEEMDRKNNKN